MLKEFEDNLSVSQHLFVTLLHTIKIEVIIYHYTVSLAEKTITITQRETAE